MQAVPTTYTIAPATGYAGAPTLSCGAGDISTIDPTDFGESSSVVYPGSLDLVMPGWGSGGGRVGFGRRFGRRFGRGRRKLLAASNTGALASEVGAYAWPIGPSRKHRRALCCSLA